LRFVNYLLNEDDDDDDDRQIDLMFSQRSPSLAALLGLQYTCVTKVFKTIDVIQKAINVNSAGNLSIYVSNTQATIRGSSDKTCKTEFAVSGSEFVFRPPPTGARSTRCSYYTPAVTDRGHNGHNRCNVSALAASGRRRHVADRYVTW